MGKTTFINTLFATEICTPRNYRHRAAKQLDKTTEIDILKADLEERGFNIKVGAVDRDEYSRGLMYSSPSSTRPALATTSTTETGERNSLWHVWTTLTRSWSPIIDFIDDQHESYMRQEQQPIRAEKQDLRVHACLYFLKPSGLS